MVFIITSPNESLPTLPINPVGIPKRCNAKPVLETGPPVDVVAGPTFINFPGLRMVFKFSFIFFRSGMTSRQICPATIICGCMDNNLTNF